MTRFDACALNRIAQLRAGDGAAAINYKGMQPKDIDRLVREALRPAVQVPCPPLSHSQAGAALEEPL